MTQITNVHATEILDSRGNPTVQVTLENQHATGNAKVPSGASTGQHEAHELRDDDHDRYHGRGVQNAVRNITDTIASSITKTSFTDQESFDETLLDLDGTNNKSRLGANALLACSMAYARLTANTEGRPLHAVFGDKPYTTPTPFCNIINGGDHAGNDLDIQEFMITPTTVTRFDEATRVVTETYHELKALIADTYGSQHTAVGDEGGFAPPINDAREALSLITEAASNAGHADAVNIAIDAAALEFYDADNDTYRLAGNEYNHDGLQSYYEELIDEYSIISLEDPFHDDAFAAFADLQDTVGDACQVVTDDLTVSNPERVEHAVETRSGRALLLKVNQIGTVTEARRAAQLAQSAGWNVMVSHRSGETEDSFIADFAVGINAAQVKIGAPCRSDRTAKYNRLLTIQKRLHD